MTPIESPPVSTLLQSWEGRGYRILLKGLIGYCLVCTLTIPFINALWLGEIPLLALVQLPKIEYANWLRSGLVMQAIRLLGLSSGSFSPDYILARPYGLAIAYLFPFAILMAVLWMRTRLVKPYGWLTILLLVVAVIDFVATLVFADQRALTIY